MLPPIFALIFCFVLFCFHFTLWFSKWVQHSNQKFVSAQPRLEACQWCVKSRARLKAFGSPQTPVPCTKNCPNNYKVTDTSNFSHSLPTRKGIWNDAGKVIAIVTVIFISTNNLFFISEKMCSFPKVAQTETLRKSYSNVWQFEPRFFSSLWT